jgi:hypothetical protein
MGRAKRVTLPSKLQCPDHPALFSDLSCTTAIERALNPVTVLGLPNRQVNVPGLCGQPGAV